MQYISSVAIVGASGGGWLTSVNFEICRFCGQREI